MTKIILGLIILLVLWMLLYILLRPKNIHLWIWGYLRHCAGLLLNRPDGMIDVMFCLVDHFEPKWENPPPHTALSRVKMWLNAYPELAKRHRDSDGKHPQHTWFYPQEEYEPCYIDLLNRMCSGDLGELELHLHHHQDSSDGFRAKIQQAIADFGQHGAFQTMDDPPRTAFAFIHGNWALDNSHPYGWFCGVNDELRILRETGCYADFTLPSAPSPTQTKKVNSIYYAVDDLNAPKSHNTGQDVRVGKPPEHDLMIVQGPLALNFRNRKFGVIPHIENSEISGANPATEERVDNWVARRIHVRGNKQWIFVKVHCHGAQERTWNALLGPQADRMHTYLETKYNDGRKYRLHYVTARECYNIIKAAEAGNTGNPSRYRDYLIKPYRNRTFLFDEDLDEFTEQV